MRHLKGAGLSCPAWSSSHQPAVHVAVQPLPRRSQEGGMGGGGTRKNVDAFLTWQLGEGTLPACLLTSQGVTLSSCPGHPMLRRHLHQGQGQQGSK